MSTEVISVPSIYPAVQSVNLAKEELLKGKRELLRQLETIEELLSNMEAVERRADYSLDKLVPVRKDEFKGKRAMEALDAYMRARKGHKIPFRRIIADLIEGGADPGSPRGSKTDPAVLIAHTLKIGIPNRPSVFEFSPVGQSKKGAPIIPKGTRDEEITVWLADTADQPKRRRRSA